MLWWALLVLSDLGLQLAWLAVPLEAGCAVLGRPVAVEISLSWAASRIEAIFASEVYSCKRNANPCSPILSSWQKKSPFTFKINYKKWAQIKSLDPNPLNSQNDWIQTQALLVGPLSDICTSLINTHRCSVKNEGTWGLLANTLVHLLRDCHPLTSFIKAPIRKVPSQMLTACLYNLKEAKEIPLKIWSTKIVSRLKNSMPRIPSVV